MTKYRSIPLMWDAGTVWRGLPNEWFFTDYKLKDHGPYDQKDRADAELLKYRTDVALTQVDKFGTTLICKECGELLEITETNEVYPCPSCLDDAWHEGRGA